MSQPTQNEFTPTEEERDAAPGRGRNYVRTKADETLRVTDKELEMLRHFGNVVAVWTEPAQPKASTETAKPQSTTPAVTSGKTEPTGAEKEKN